MPRSDMFGLLEADMDGRRLLASIDFSFVGFPKKESFPWFLSLSTALKEADSEGLPTNAETAALNHWEDEVESVLSAAVGFKYIGRVTWSGHRELLYYLAEPIAPTAALQKMIEARSTRQFTFRCQRDDSWGHVEGYLSA